MTPHYTQREAADMPTEEVEARRYVNFRFLRREAPTSPLTAHLDDNGWWSPLESQVPSPVDTSAGDVVAALSASGGSWASKRQARLALGVGSESFDRMVARAIKAGAIVEERTGTRFSYQLIDRADPKD